MRSLIYTWLLMLAGVAFAQIGDDSASTWSNILKSGNGKVVFYWYPYSTEVSESKDIIDGVEHELAAAFIAYVEAEYKVELDVEWKLAIGFNDVLNTVSNSQGGIFGASSISITPERQEILNFTPPYLPDIAVLVSSGNIPIARSEEEFLRIFDDMMAVTIPNTTTERKLLVLRDTQGLNYDISYVENGGQVIETVAAMENGFGYVDLPNFLVALEESSNIKRQFFHPLKLDGLSFVYPKKSDWDEPVNQYFQSQQYQKDKERVISKYLGNEVMELIEQVSKSAEIGPYEEISILMEEKELQYKELLNAAEKAQDEQQVRNLLIGGVALLLLIALLILISYSIKSKANRSLTEKQELIEKRNQQLVELNDEKNNLIKVLAHDLRAPIAQILGFSRLIKESVKLSAEEKEMMGYIEHSSDRLRKMIGKILDVDAIESGRKNVNIEKVNVHAAVKEVIDDFEQAATQKKIELTDVSSTDERYVEADQVYLVQIIENLVSNALKFSKEGSKIAIDVASKNSEVIISVTDNGPGFSTEDEIHIFKKYRQLSAKSTAGEPSTGLGLSIVKKYVEMMGGKISYETKLGQGTTFYIRLKELTV